MNPLHALLAIAAGVGIALASRPARAAGAEKIPFPTDRYGRNDLMRIAAVVEDVTRMPGFSDFAVSVAQNESRFNNLAIDDSEGALRQAVLGLKNNPGRYGATAWPRSWYTWGTGGWYQFVPSTALASEEWNDADPMLVFDPIVSTVLLASFIQRVQRNHFHQLPSEHRDWRAMRRFMRSNRAGYDFDEVLPGTKGKRERYGRDLEKNGISESFMYRAVPRHTERATPELYARVAARLQFYP